MVDFWIHGAIISLQNTQIINTENGDEQIMTENYFGVNYPFKTFDSQVTGRLSFVSLHRFPELLKWN